MIITGFVINLRHALYSASVAPYVRHLNPAWKGILAYLLTDEAYAVTITHYQQEGDQSHRHWYFLGAGLALWTSWQISTAAGVFLGAQVPASWGLEFTLALTFIALVVPQIKDRPSLLAALTAGLVVRARRRAAVQAQPADRRAGGNHRRVVERAKMEVNIWVVMVAIGALTFLTRLVVHRAGRPLGSASALPQRAALRAGRHPDRHRRARAGHAHRDARSLAHQCAPAGRVDRHLRRLADEEYGADHRHRHGGVLGAAGNNKVTLDFGPLGTRFGRKNEAGSVEKGASRFRFWQPQSGHCPNQPTRFLFSTSCRQFRSKGGEILFCPRAQTGSCARGYSTTSV